MKVKEVFELPFVTAVTLIKIRDEVYGKALATGNYFHDRVLDYAGANVRSFTYCAPSDSIQIDVEDVRGNGTTNE